MEKYIKRERNGQFCAYHPVTKIVIGRFNNWFDAFKAVQLINK